MCINYEIDDTLVDLTKVQHLHLCWTFDDFVLVIYLIRSVELKKFSDILQQRNVRNSNLVSLNIILDVLIYIIIIMIIHKKVFIVINSLISPFHSF